ncbi:efflux RND transporter permease subunit [Luteolibacter soli]|uniref:Efflux RND transporter permease subunit n=1 Tax=Luteolibacter soli TaxID=3135280 RepID=A0ABU9B1Z3_9BACT
MLRSLIHFSLRYRAVVVVTGLLVMAIGVWQAPQMPLDVFPDFVPPQVTIQTETPGLAPEQVEQLVTYPIEAAVSGIAGIEMIRSESGQGLSVVSITFADSSDILADRQLLTERMAEMGTRLPKEAKAPTLSPLVSSTMDLLKVGITSTKLSPLELRTFADWNLAPLLRAIPGVAEVSVVGGESRRMEVKFDQDQMTRYGVTLADITRATTGATGTQGAGYIETPNQRLVLDAESIPVDPGLLGATIVRGSGGDAIHLRDVAHVTLAAAPKFGDALIQGEPGVLLAMTSQYGANTLEVTRRVEAALDNYADALATEQITLHRSLHRPANFIELAIHHIRDSILIGIGLVVVVLLLFLRSPRTAFISFISIPMSLIGAMLVFRSFGITLNTMTLGGFAVAIGVVVDDAIIDVENIVRRLRLNALLETPLPAAEVVLEASIEVRGAIVFATLIVIAAFIPVFVLGGVQERFFAPLGLAFVVATAISLLIAVTVTPALCSLFLHGHAEDREPFYLRWLRSIHTALLTLFTRYAVLASLLVLAAGVGAAMLVPRLKTEFLPEFREGHFVIQVAAIPGTSLREMNRLGERISHELLQDPRILSVEFQAGRAEQGVDTWGPERAEMHVELNPDPSLDEAAIQDDLRDLLGKYPGIQSEVLTFLGDRIGESISGETAAGIVSIYGNDLGLLADTAATIAGLLKETPGATDVIAKATEGSPRIGIRMKPRAMEQFGLLPADVMTAVQTAYQGAEVSNLYQWGQIIPVVLVGPGSQGSIAGLGDLPLIQPPGPTVRLADVAEIFIGSGHAVIEHEGGRRLQRVTFNAGSRPISAVMAEAQHTIASKVHPGGGTQITYTGAAEAESQANRNLIVSSALALAIIVLILWMAFRNGRHLTLVLANLPFALIGGVFAIFLTGIPMSLGALVGFVALFGISARNAIMMISHYEHLVLDEGLPWNRETAIRGAGERLIPVLMTALVTALVLIPIALRPTAAGQEIEGPMAIVILGGLISSTLLTLLLLPALAERFAHFPDPHPL